MLLSRFFIPFCLITVAALGSWYKYIKFNSAKPDRQLGLIHNVHAGQSAVYDTGELLRGVATTDRDRPDAKMQGAFVPIEYEAVQHFQQAESNSPRISDRR